MSHSVDIAPTPRPAVRDEAGATGLADGSQAEYFRRVLEGQRADLAGQQSDELRVLSARIGSGNAFGVKALRRRIRLRQRQLDELDRMLRALDAGDRQTVPWVRRHQRAGGAARGR